MKNLWGVYVFISFFSLNIFACSSKSHVENLPPFIVSDISLSKEIDKNETRAVPREKTDYYITDDHQIFALLNLFNIRGNHKLRWDWHDPNGNIYFSTGDFSVEIPEGQYIKESSTWHSINLKGDKAVDYPGQWEVKAYLNNVLVKSTRFNLENIPNINEIPVTTQKINPNNWGLVIGIQDYLNLPLVKFARKDALIVRDYFHQVFGMPKGNIITLLDASATKPKIENTIREYLADNVEDESTLYIYYAGHGVPGKIKGEPILLPYDSNIRDISKTGYKLEDLYQDLEDLDIKMTYVFLDSNFNVNASRTTEMLSNDLFPVSIGFDKANITTKNIITFSAAKPNQHNNAYPEIEHGLFTYYLIRALRGEANQNSDSWISVKEAYSFIRKHVGEVSLRIGNEQTPVIMPDVDNIKDSPIITALE